MYSFQAPSQKYGIFAAITVLLIGLMLQIFQEGFKLLKEPSFWLGIYGWLATAIVVGSLVYLGFSLLGLCNSHSNRTNTNEQPSLALGTQVPAGKLPPWEIDNLPPPPSFNFRNIITTIGPSAILLGTSIGSGEWLLGPAVTAQYGGFLLWLVPVAIVLQAIINTEFIRYTLYTGEPIYTGFMRTNPGVRFWSIFYTSIAFLQLSWPGWASSAATALTALFIGEVPGSQHANLIRIFGLIWFLSIATIIIFGAKIEQTIELVQWFFVAAIVLFLAVVTFYFTSPITYQTAWRGITTFGVIPPGLDWLLLSAFIADAGAGGVINGTLSNWFRDKGFGMGGVVGYIPAIIGGRRLSLTQTGKVFPLTPENKQRWRGWWKFVDVDQYGIWAIGCFLGMLLPALLTLEFIPPGTKFVNQFGIAVYQAQYIVWATGKDIFWVITLLIGFWILYSTQLGITDAFVRMVTDMIWSSSSRLRQWRGGDIRLIYYGVLFLFILWGVLVLFLEVKPLFLILLGANIAALNIACLGLHTLYINRKFLPVELRPPLWREIVVFLGVIFYGFFFFKAAPELFHQLFSWL
jgi:hypothetical protein